MSSRKKRIQATTREESGYGANSGCGKLDEENFDRIENEAFLVSSILGIVGLRWYTPFPGGLVECWI